MQSIFLSEKEPDQDECPECGDYVHNLLMAHHLYGFHEEYARTTSHEDPFFKDDLSCRCPLCQDGVHKVNLRRHFKNFHNITIPKTMKVLKPPANNPFVSKEDSRRNLFKKFFPDLEQDPAVKVNCPVCTKEMASDRFADHYQSNHWSRCAICDITFKTYYQKIKHMATVHDITNALDRSNEKTHECHICGQKFLHPSGVRNHIVAMHEQDRSFLCDICGDAFLRKSTLKSHRRRHSNIKLYQCKICTNRYGDVSALKKHLKNTHNLVTAGRWNDPFIDREALPWRKLTENEAKDMQVLPELPPEGVAAI